VATDDEYIYEYDPEMTAIQNARVSMRMDRLRVDMGPTATQLHAEVMEDLKHMDEDYLNLLRDHGEA